MTSRKRRNQGGTSSGYLISKIAWDRPDILERMKHLEYSSMAQAARDAGIEVAKPLKRVAEVLTTHYSPLQAVFDDLHGNVDVRQHDVG